jgi:acetyl esterase/lipase
MTSLKVIPRILAWGAALAWLAALWGRDPLAVREGRVTADLGIVKDVPYRDGSVHALLDVYSPPHRHNGGGSPRRYPAILAIHGGSWRGGSKSEYGPQVSRLARHGMVVFVPDYRLARPGSPSWPEVLEDLRMAVRWVRVHAAEFKVDPERIIALGSSSGGHLAELLGTSPAEASAEQVSSRVRAVVSLYGPSDLARLIASRRLVHDPVSILLGGVAAASPADLAAASPDAHVSGDAAAMLLIHGSDDRWVPPGQSESMARSLGRAGVANRLLIVDGARHGFELSVGYPEIRDLVPEILAFLENLWQVPRGDLP